MSKESVPIFLEVPNFLLGGCRYHIFWKPTKSSFENKIGLQYWPHGSDLHKTKIRLYQNNGICITFLEGTVPPSKINKVKNFWNRFNCAPAKWALEKERRREGECLTLPLNLFKKQWAYLFLPVVLLKWSMIFCFKGHFWKVNCRGKIYFLTKKTFLPF